MHLRGVHLMRGSCLLSVGKLRRPSHDSRCTDADVETRNFHAALPLTRPIAARSSYKLYQRLLRSFQDSLIRFQLLAARMYF